MPRLSVLSSGLLLTLLLVALCNVAAVPARLSHLASPSTDDAVDTALIESSARSFKACNLGDARCTSYQAFGFCCPAGSSLSASREGPNRYVGKCTADQPGNKAKCAKKPKSNYKPPRFPACKKGNASCRDNKYGEKVVLGGWCCPGGSDLESKGYDIDAGKMIGPITCIGRRFRCAPDESDDEDDDE